MAKIELADIMETLDKIDSLKLHTSTKSTAKTVVRCIMDTVKTNWIVPTVWNDRANKYICIVWEKDTRSLTLNVDDEDTWWSMHWDEGDKIKTGFHDIDTTNLTKHWSWLING